MTTPTPLDQMRAAMHAGDATSIRGLLERHADLRAMVNEPIGPFDSPPLVAVAGRGDIELVDVLLEFDADPNRRSAWWAGGFHALHSATGAVAERLLAAGAVPDACAAAHLDRADLLERMLAEDPSRVHERGGDGQTPLHFARSRRVVDMLLTAGADPDARDVDHRATPAQWMLDRRRGAGRYDLAAYLVQRGATPDIFLAAALGLTDRARVMLQADQSLLDLRTSHGAYGEQPPSSFHIYMWTIGANLSPLDVAMQFEQHDTADALGAFANPRQRLLAACAAGDAAGAKAVLAEHPNVVAMLTSTDLSALPNAGWANNARAVDLMLELGFDPRTPGQDAGTVLHCAAWQGSAECVEVVLRHAGGRALVDAREPTHGGTPLDWCCHGSRNCRSPGRDHVAVARLLVGAGGRAGRNLADATAEVRAVIETGGGGGQVLS